MKQSFVIKDAKGYIEKFYYEFCNGRSARIKIEDKLHGKVWYFPTGGDGYKFLLYMLDAGISSYIVNLESFREDISMYQKIGNRWVEIDNTNFYNNTEREYNIIIEQLI